MPSTIISVLASAIFIAATVANPIADARVVGPIAQINAGCSGRIVNLFSFTSDNCSNTATSPSTPFFSNQKVVAEPNRVSRCIRVNTPNYEAGSFVYTSDGVDTGSCTLQLFDSDECVGQFFDSVRVNADVSGCIKRDFQAVKLACKA